jgi:hypothetical protein
MGRRQPHARSLYRPPFWVRHTRFLTYLAGAIGGTIAALAMIGLIYLVKLFGGLL